MLEEIDMLREKLENQVLKDDCYESILNTSKQIDNILIDYYKATCNLGKFI